MILPISYRDFNTSLLIMIINCNSVKNRKAELENMVDYLNSVMILVETKMDSSVNYSEFLPASYKCEIRKDRSSHGGSVMIAYKDTLAVVEADIPLVDAVMVWAKAELDDNEVVYIGAYYRAPTDRTCDTLDDLHKVIGSLPKNSHIVLGGDFNAGDIRWDSNTVAPNSDRRGLCERLLEVLDDHQLKQARLSRRENLQFLICIVQIVRVWLSQSV